MGVVSTLRILSGLHEKSPETQSIYSYVHVYRYACPLCFSGFLSTRDFLEHARMYVNTLKFPQIYPSTLNFPELNGLCALECTLWSCKSFCRYDMMTYATQRSSS